MKQIQIVKNNTEVDQKKKGGNKIRNTGKKYIYR